MATAAVTGNKVMQLLTEGMGLHVRPSADGYWVDFTDASTRVQISVRDWLPSPHGEPQTVVVLEALVLEGVHPIAALYEWAASEGGSMPFGHVVVHESARDPGTVYLLMTHTLLGDYLDQRELETALWGVLFAADSWDDELQRRFGGRRAKDVRRSAGS